MANKDIEFSKGIGLQYMVEHMFGLPKIGHFIYLLRSLGICVRGLIQQQLPTLTARQQYVAACILSIREIERASEDVFQSAWTYLNSNRVNCKYAYVSFRRASVVMNYPGCKSHTEVRLFDPKREILNEMLPHTRGQPINTSMENLIEKMKADFIRQYGKSEGYILMINSYLIPCTESNNMCSELIREYVKRSGDHVIVAYEHLHEKTNLSVATDNLKHDNIYAVDAEQVKKLIKEEELAIMQKSEHVRRLHWDVSFASSIGVHLEEFYKETSRRQQWCTYNAHHRHQFNEQTRLKCILAWQSEDMRRRQWTAQYYLKVFQASFAWQMECSKRHK